MEYQEYQEAFTKKALAARLSPAYVDSCLAYAQALFAKGLPVVYDIQHFSKLVGYSRHYLERSIVFTNYFYRTFEIKKNNGGSRKISEPLPSLMEIQDWILNNILNEVKPSKFAKAYVRGVTLKQNLVFHKNQKIVLGLDLQDFFSNIKQEQVQKLFRSLSYSKRVSDLLAKLCTLNDRLPQGAPTSPAISNLIMLDFDNRISEYALENGYRYTRYADDITISGDVNVKLTISKISQELGEIGQTLNPNKIRIMRQGTRQVVTGIVVNEIIQVSRAKRKAIRQAIYYIKHRGLVEHLKRINYSGSDYIKHLLGSINFVLFINPKDEEFKEYREYLEALEDERGVS